jgi:hypothetical protein
MFCESEKIIGHSTDWWSAIGTMVNAVVVVVLVVINFFYLKAANRQATAAEKQTGKIQEQNGLTRKALLHALGLDKAERRARIFRAESELRKIKAALDDLDELLRQPAPNYLSVNESSIFPDTWEIIACCVEQEIDEGAFRARELQGDLMDTSSEFQKLKEWLRSANPSDLVMQRKEAVRGKVRSSSDAIIALAQLLQHALILLRSVPTGTE